MELEILTPPDIDELTQDILVEVRQTAIPPNKLQPLVDAVETFQRHWSTHFDQFGRHVRGELAYRDLILGFREHIRPMANPWLQPKTKGKIALGKISSMLSSPQKPLVGQLRVGLRNKRQDRSAGEAATFSLPEFDRPIFIVSAPRAGSTLLFETLAQFEQLWTIGIESHEIIEGIPKLHPRTRNFSSNRLTEVDAAPQVCAQLRRRFTQQLRDRTEQKYLDLPPTQRPSSIRFLEKTPKNALRIPFLQAALPGAMFIYLYREPKGNISSIIEGWRSRRFVSYRNIPDWTFREWSFFLPVGYSALQDCSIAEIAAYQWKTANSTILGDLQNLPPSSWCLLRYDDLINNPEQVIRQMGQFASLDWGANIEGLVSQSLPVSSMSFSTPSSDKWKKNAAEIMPLLPSLNSVMNDVETIQVKTY